MKKPEITEGPWEIGHKQTIYHQGGGPETKSYRPCIAQVSEWRKSGDGNPTKEAKANAQVISAAPDMLDALMDAYKAVDSLPDDALGVKAVNNGSGEPERQPIKLELMHNIQEALKKAGCK